MNLIKEYENVKRITIVISSRLQLLNESSSIAFKKNQNNKSSSIKRNRIKKSKIKLNHIIQFAVIDKIFFVVLNIFVLIFFKQKFVVIIFSRSITFSLFVITFIAMMFWKFFVFDSVIDSSSFFAFTSINGFVKSIFVTNTSKIVMSQKHDIQLAMKRATIYRSQDAIDTN